MIFDLKLLSLCLLYYAKSILERGIIPRTTWDLLTKHGVFNIYLCPLEAIEVFEVNMCAN